MFSKLKITSRLALLNATVVFFTILLVVVGYSMVSNMTSSMTDMYNKGLVGSKLLADGNNAVWELRFGIANYTLATPENRKKILDGRPNLYSKLEESLTKYTDLGFLQRDDSTMKDLLSSYQQYKSSAPHWFELIDANKMDEAADYRAKVTNVAGGAMVKNLKSLLESQLKTNEELEKSSLSTSELAHKQLLVLSLSISIFTSGFIYLLSRSITSPLESLRSTIVGVEKDHDFTKRVQISGTDEVGQIAKSFNDLIVTLQQSLNRVLACVDKVYVSAESLSSSAKLSTAMSSHQSEATSGMAAAIEELTASIEQVSSSAHRATEISDSSGKFSIEGSETISKATSEMAQIAGTVREAASDIEKLGEQSDKVSSIVQVIKEVADQTNLLALNAAIEAARAGEQGRGFAVVADEVRKLAERTSKATEQITTMIDEMQQSTHSAVTTMHAAVGQVTEGVELANHAGSAMIKIRESSSQVNVVVTDITSALAEQNQASKDISIQVGKVAEITEENTTTINQTATSANDLHVLANEMRTEVSRFKI